MTTIRRRFDFDAEVVLASLRAGAEKQGFLPWWFGPDGLVYRDAGKSRLTIYLRSRKGPTGVEADVLVIPGPRGCEVVATVSAPLVIVGRIVNAAFFCGVLAAVLRDPNPGSLRNVATVAILALLLLPRVFLRATKAERQTAALAERLQELFESISTRLVAGPRPR